MAKKMAARKDRSKAAEAGIKRALAGTLQQRRKGNFFSFFFLPHPTSSKPNFDIL